MSSYRLALLAAALAWAQQASAVTLTGSANAPTTQVNGFTTVTLNLNLSDPLDLGAVTLTMDWSTPGLEYEGASGMIFGQSVTDFAAQFDPAFSSITQTSSELDVSLIPLAGPPPSLQAGPVTLSFTFKGLAAGTQVVHVFLDLADPSFNDVFLNGDSTPLSTTVAVTDAVPELPPALMLASGLAVFGLLARRRRPL